MIKIESYEKSFEDEFWETVAIRIDEEDRDLIIESCKKFLPENFFVEKEPFRELILAPFDKLKSAEKHISCTIKKNMDAECFEVTTEGTLIKPLYMKVLDAYIKVAKSKRNGASMRVRIVRNTGLTVCPYCNMDYINCRADDVSGAQLDHFYSKSKYPLFAVCLYNLVPVCANCNRIKSNKEKEFASPFDTSIDWDIEFKYHPKRVKGKKIAISSRVSSAVDNNIKIMRIEDAYQIHTTEIDELIAKANRYPKTQLDEFKKVLHKIEVSELEMKEAIFGKRISPEDMKRKPLGKMLSEFHKEYNIYN